MNFNPLKLCTILSKCCSFDCPCHSTDFPSALLADLLRVLPFSPVRLSLFYELSQSVFARTLLRCFSLNCVFGRHLQDRLLNNLTLFFQSLPDPFAGAFEFRHLCIQLLFVCVFVVRRPPNHSSFLISILFFEVPPPICEAHCPSECFVVTPQRDVFLHLLVPAVIGVLPAQSQFGVCSASSHALPICHPFF